MHHACVAPAKRKAGQCRNATADYKLQKCKNVVFPSVE